MVLRGGAARDVAAACRTTCRPALQYEMGKTKIGGDRRCRDRDQPVRAVSAIIARRPATIA